MTKNVKRIFFVLTLLTLLIAISTVNAADDANSTDEIISSPQTASSDTISQQTTVTSDNNINTRNIEKTTKELKKDSITIDDIEYTNTIENQEITSETSISENTFLNNCTVSMSGWDGITNDAVLYINASVIDCYVTNNQNKIIIINNSDISGTYVNWADTFVYNSSLNCLLTNYANITFSDDSTFTEGFEIGSNYGKIIINDTSKLTPYQSEIREDIIFNNKTFRGDKYNYANLTFIDCQIIGSITNYGNLTIVNSTTSRLTNDKNAYVENSLFNGTLLNRGNLTLTDDVSFGTSFRLTNYGNIIINDSNIIYPYLSTFKGDHHLSNMIIDKAITNDVQSNLTLSNVTLNKRITNQGTLIIEDDCVFGSGFSLTNNGNIIINDSSVLYPYLSTFRGENLLNNITIDKRITNNGNLTLNNVTVDNTINNYGILIIGDDCIFTENANIDDNGQIIINDTSKIAPYLSTYDGDYIIGNMTIDSSKTNYGNLVIVNATINEQINNYGTLTINNSLLNGYLYNEGILILDDETVFGESFYIEGEGEIITNNTDAIIPYLTVYNGNYTINNLTLENDKTNLANLTIINSTLYNYIENQGNLSIINSLLDGSINNNAILNISDDCVFGENLELSGNGEYIYSDISKLIPYMSTINQDSTIENVTLTGYKTNNANITIKNSTLDCILTNNGILNISDDCLFGENFLIRGSGQVICDDFDKIMPYLSSINGNYTFRNKNITNDVTYYGNIELINCNISAKITNYNNLSIINSSLSNNVRSVTRGKEDGFLIYNLGNVELIGCIMENNTFDTTITYYYNSLKLYGAMVNNANMTIINSTFNNNKVGHYFAESYNNYYGNSFGNGSIVYNNGLLTIDNSNFTNNYAGSSGGAIVNNKNLTINNSKFTANKAIVSGGAIGLNNGRTMITNTVFTGNNATLELTINDLCGGGAIYASNGEMIIDNCTFDNNQALCTITGLAGVNSNGGSITLLNMKANITNSTFKNHQKEIIQGGYLYGTINMNTTISECIFENNNGGIIDYTRITIINNTFKNTTGNEVIYNYKTASINKTIADNIFINNSISTETIYTYTASGYGNTLLNLTAENNIYQNTTINDTIELNIPDEIYEGQSITINGSYTINNPDNYDSNILEQNKFNIYINGQLTQTVDELTFTLTPQSGTTLITVQPTISQTRKTAALSSVTISNITITPENYDDYIYEGALIGVAKGSTVTFTGEFNNKDEIYVDTEGIILNGENAIFTNTIFTLDADNIVLRNMIITNNQYDYTISNYGNDNTITNNTITTRKDEEKIAAIKNLASNTTISNNILTVSGPANTIDFSETSISDTQAILLLGGDNNKIVNNTITVNCSGINTFYGTIEAITNSEGATNTLIKQNNINLTGANFNYGINCLVNDENITITENTMIITGERYCDGVQVGNGVKNILITDNNITCICINTTVLQTEGAITYGVIASNMGSSQSENITVDRNNIDITGTANYAIEFYKVENTQVNDNNITVNGPFSLGIAYSYSPNGVATGNTINTSGDGNTPINYITEEVKQENTGIRIQNGTQNILIENNSITTSDEALNDSTIHSDVANITIRNNVLSSSNKSGDASLIVPLNAIVENNTAPDNQSNPDEDDQSNYTTVIVTPENINQYVNFNYETSGHLNFEPFTKAIFVGTFSNYGLDFRNNNIIIDGSNATFTDVVFSITRKSNITIQNAKMNSSPNTIGSLIASSERSTNITIKNNTLYLYNTESIDTTYAQWGLISPFYSHGIFLFNINDSIIENNTIYIYGPSVDQNSNQPNTYAIELRRCNNISITDNIITVENTTQPTEESLINGIWISFNSTNIKITDNMINVSGAVTTTAINNTNPDESNIIENNIISENPIIAPIITLEDITGVINMPTTIRATVTDNDQNAISDGTVTFMDEDENILGQSSLTDGTATITVTFTEELTTELIAVYTPASSQYLESYASSMLTVEPPRTVIAVSTDNLIAGKTVTLKATVTDQAGNNINGGKVTFKVNGKTVKDANGKVIYAKVVDGVAQVEYTVPDNLAGKDVNITAVYSGSAKYNKESTTITKTTAAPEPTLTITPITSDVQTGSTITLKAKVAAGDKAITTGKIVFKINGKTVKDENGKVIYAKVDSNGEVSVDYNIPESYKQGNYTIEATLIAPGYDKITSNTTMTVVKA